MFKLFLFQFIVDFVSLSFLFLFRFVLFIYRKLCRWFLLYSCFDSFLSFFQYNSRSKAFSVLRVFRNGKCSGRIKDDDGKFGVCALNRCSICRKIVKGSQLLQLPIILIFYIENWKMENWETFGGKLCHKKSCALTLCEKWGHCRAKRRARGIRSGWERERQSVGLKERMR